MVTLFSGALMVSVGGRLFIDSFSEGIPMLVVTGMIFFIGQSITRFEDFPTMSHRVAQMDAWLTQKKVLFTQSHKVMKGKPRFDVPGT